jgi:hypothetical protein
MDMKNVTLILILTTLAGALALYSEEISHYFAGPRPDQLGPAIGEILTVNGLTEHRLRGEIEFVRTRSGQAIGNFMTIRTAPEGNAELALYNRYVIRLEPDSEVIFEELSHQLKQLVVTLRKGNFTILKEGSANTLLTVNQDLIDVRSVEPSSSLNIEVPPQIPETRQETTPQVQLLQPTPEVKLPQNTPSPQSAQTLPKKLVPAESASHSLSDTYINNVISAQKQFFLRCYAKLLQRKPSAQGDMTFSFVINQKGKVENIRLIKNSIRQKSVANCAKNVLKNTKFRPFDGKPISVTYPLAFK